MSDGLPSEIFVIPLVTIFLFILIILCILKLNIFFNSYNFLSKKINADKVTYISNISFYKFYYNKNERLQGVIIERLITSTFIILALLAFGGILFNKTINYGSLNYYYGDIEEYSFLNNFIIFIIILAIIYCGFYMYWIVYDKDNDDILYKDEDILRDFIINNVDYKYLGYYTSKKDDIETNDNIILNKYINDNMKTINNLLSATENPIYLFQLCFTYHLMNSGDQANTKLIYITKNIKDKLKELHDIDKKDNEQGRQAIANAISDIDIIANYNNSNETALPQLYKLINDFKKALNEDNKKGLNINIENINTNLINNNTDEKTTKILGIYDNAKTVFKNPIVQFKKMYDKYYMYYIISVFITNIIITYAILIFIYIFIRLYDLILNKSYETVYEYKKIIKAYISYILLLYYLITCPIIIFSYN
jgi:hypothetical protein